MWSQSNDNFEESFWPNGRIFGRFFVLDKELEKSGQKTVEKTRAPFN